jgi:RHS repeat-associated protein
MNSDGHRFLKPGGVGTLATRRVVFRVCLLLSAFWFLTSAVNAAIFSGNVRLEVTDPTGGLSWNSSANAMMVQCWFKISIPSGTNLTENMTILVNRRTGTQADPHAFLIQYNLQSGNVEFSARGSGAFTNALIARPYLERWYHVAVVRQGEAFSAYVDGRFAFSTSASVGNAATTEGISIGGWGNGKYLFGEVQEVSIYQNVPPDPQAFIVQNMFSSQPTNDPSLSLKGYFPLAYSTNSADQYKNFATPPVPTGTEAANPQGSGSVKFEEANEAGEQSAFDARKNGGRDALTPLSGGFSWQQTALARPTPGVALDFRFGYSSANVSGTYSLNGFDPYAFGPMGKGWRHSFETRLLPAQSFSPLSDTDTIGLMAWDGSLETWDKDQTTGDYFTRDREYRGEFILTSTNCQWTTPERVVYVFRKPDSGSAVMRGRLTAIHDFNSNNVRILWNETSGVITQVVDSAGGRLNLNYQSGLLTNISFASWQVNFGYDATNRLVAKTLTNTSGLYTAVSNTWQFQYDTNGLLARIVDPRGNTNTFAQYDQYGRQTNQVDALGRATATRYGTPGNRQITRIDPGTNSWLETHDRKGHILAQQDPLTNITSYTYDSNGNRISITEPLGWTTFFGYDTRANVIARTNALGEVTAWSFHSFFNKAIQQITPQPTNINGSATWTNFYGIDDRTGNLMNHWDALGSLVSYTYSTNGLVLTSTDANGNTSQFAYDANGFLIARTDPATNTWQFTVNDVGWKLAEINPFNDATTYTYDLNGNVVQVTDPLNRMFTRQYDANGNLVAQSDGKNQFTRHAYDAANQRVATTNRVGSVWQFTFTSRGKPDRATDPLGNTTTNFYDSANRLIAVSDPLGNTITNQYDANGNLVARFDPLGQRWSKTFDRLNRVIAESDPQGDTKQTSYDLVGRISQIITPNGFPSLHFYDGRGRLTKWKDAEGFDWLYAYDGNGNITNITDALNGHYVMTYGPRNERTLERNQDNFEWQYTYDQLLRLKTQRDPNGIVRTRDYDPASRVTSLTLNTGRENIYAYDDNDNPRVIARRLNGVAVATTSLTYDPLDRATHVVDPNSQSLDYGFDALSRIVSVTYPGNHTLTNRYDALSRLTNQVDWAGRQMSYDYDKAGRLIRRAYPNGVVQTNTFDSAGRLTSLSHSTLNPQPSTNGQPSTLNIALTYAYDRNGNKVGNSESGTLAWPLPSLFDETSRFTAAGRITNRVDALNPATNNFTYQYDPSGNMTNAAGAGQIWRLVYDEDNRVTSLFWTNGVLNDKVITNRYDALGRRIARKVDGIETRYVLDLSGGMERILCDTTSSGQVTAYYIHGPDLCYRVDASNNIICYHADAQANIISVTDGGGTNVAQYAYTPYGRSLGSTNSQPSTLNSQPYLFVGSQGVMEELPGLYFMRARYYSADAGVLLSTDPVKKVGPGWKPKVYAYANQNPLSLLDPSGRTVIILGVAGGATAAGGLGGQAQGMYGRALELGTRRMVDVECVSAGASVGAEAGVSGSLDLGVYPGAKLEDINNEPYAYAGLEGGALGRGGADVILDQSGKVAGYELQLGLEGGGGGSFHGGIGNCVTVPGTERTLGSRANSGTLQSSTAGTTPMAIGIPMQPSQQQVPSFQLNGGGGGGGSSGSGGGGSGVFAGGQSLAGNAVNAGIFGGLMTAINQTPTAAPTGNSGSSGGGRVNLGGGGNSLSPTTGPISTTQYIPPSPAPSQPSSTSIWTGVVNAVTSAWNWFFHP